MYSSSLARLRPSFRLSSRPYKTCSTLKDYIQRDELPSWTRLLLKIKHPIYTPLSLSLGVLPLISAVYVAPYHPTIAVGYSALVGATFMINCDNWKEHIFNPSTNIETTFELFFVNLLFILIFVILPLMILCIANNIVQRGRLTYEEDTQLEGW